MVEWRFVADRLMWPLVVVVMAIGLTFQPDIFHGQEPILVNTFSQNLANVSANALSTGLPGRDRSSCAPSLPSGRPGIFRACIICTIVELNLYRCMRNPQLLVQTLLDRSRNLFRIAIRVDPGM